MQCKHSWKRNHNVYETRMTAGSRQPLSLLVVLSYSYLTETWPPYWIAWRTKSLSAVAFAFWPKRILCLTKFSIKWKTERDIRRVWQLKVPHEELIFIHDIPESKSGEWMPWLTNVSHLMTNLDKTATLHVVLNRNFDSKCVRKLR